MEYRTRPITATTSLFHKELF